MNIHFYPTYIRFTDYPFEQSTLYHHGRLDHTDILDVDPLQAPPEIRTRRGETIFVPASARDYFLAEIEEHAWPQVSRIDVWGLLLEPFLDTTFSDEMQAKTRQRLYTCQLTEADIDNIRQAVGPITLNYNSIVWDWVHLGLYDLLMATRLTVTPPILPTIHQAASTFGIGKQSRASRFYAQAMRIADLGRVQR